MIALLGLPDDTWGYGLFVLVWGIVVICVIVALVFLEARTKPFLARVKEGEPKLFSPAYKACCPPGLGCNDPHVRTACRRTLGYELADAEEVEQLDRYWSAYQRDPSKASLRTWENHRDTLIDHKLSNAVDDKKKKSLLGHNRTTEIQRTAPPLEIASGEGEVELTDRPWRSVVDDVKDTTT